MSRLSCPTASTCRAAIGDRQRFATSGWVLLERSQLVVPQPAWPWRFIATAYSQRFVANGARCPDVSAARRPCYATIGDR
jgi:hypothetical protein